MGLDNENYEIMPTVSPWAIFWSAFVVGMLIVGCL